MASVPGSLVDLGLTAVALFFFVLAIFYVFRIVQAVRGKAPESNGRHAVPCIQSPQLQAIMSNQAVTMEAMRKLEEGGEQIKQNMVLQTKLIEQMGHVLEKLSECAVRQEARHG